ncbi:MAG: hypothetical protein LBF34_04195 [Puniceicoccales bacterium]|jgi:hypothetical protein|nr:hypothetical protein [Puniceicoccales bacterium]
MGILKKIVRNSLVGFCFLLATGIWGAVAAENKLQQYNAILDPNQPVFGCEPGEILDRVRSSRNGNDNVAAIRIKNKTYVIVSSIIDEDLYDLFKKGNPLPDPRPISVMDLLYLYKPKDGDQGLIEGFDLANRVTQARNNPNRVLVVAMMKTVVELFSQKKEELFKGEPQYNKDVGELEMKLIKNNRVIACQALPRFINCVKESLNDKDLNDLEIGKLAIIDFLNRLRKYAQDTAVIPNEIEDPNPVDNVLKSTQHYASGCDRLTEEIGAQIEEISADAQLERNRTIVAKGMVNLVRLVRGPWLGIGHIWRLYINFADNVMEMKYGQDLNPDRYVAAITHTEQMSDWLGAKLGVDILVEISGKAPCLKCSHYIQYAIKPNSNSRVKNAWNERTVIAFRSGCKRETEMIKYRYPFKVFNDKNCVFWTFVNGNWELDHLGQNWGNKDGKEGSNCYINNHVERYGQLQMQVDGSVEKKEVSFLISAEE